MKRIRWNFWPAKKIAGRSRAKAVLNPAEKKRQEALLLLEKARQEQEPIKFLLLENNLDAVALREMNLSAKILRNKF